ncbi:MAG: FAD-binding protein, partial [Alphaproteobacteria bacterium]|nr:FAD-binding protein [Alphaproteobacteria bacterium]
MVQTLRLATTEQVRQAVAWAAATGSPVEVVGGGSKRALGRPISSGHRIETTALAGVSLYEPAELVLTAGAGTRITEIETLLAGEGQRLAFEPPDYGPLLGTAPGATIGGVLATNLSGPRRPSAGAARDHFLGLKAVSGRGEVFKSGGRVVKNVTGYDLAKLLAGSFGTLAVLTEVTLKVMPIPETTQTILLLGLEDDVAVRVLGQVGRGPHEATGLAHVPRAAASRSAVPAIAQAGRAATAVRLEGPEPSVLYRAAALRAELTGCAPLAELEGSDSELFWREMRDVSAFAAQ